MQEFEYGNLGDFLVLNNIQGSENSCDCDKFGKYFFYERLFKIYLCCMSIFYVRKEVGCYS